MTYRSFDALASGKISLAEYQHYFAEKRRIVASAVEKAKPLVLDEMESEFLYGDETAAPLGLFIVSPKGVKDTPTSDHWKNRLELVLLGAFGNLIPHRFAHLLKEETKFKGTVQGVHKPLPHLIPNHLKTKQERRFDYDDDEPMYPSFRASLSRDHDPVSILWNLIGGSFTRVSYGNLKRFRRYARSVRSDYLRARADYGFRDVRTEG